MFSPCIRHHAATVAVLALAASGAAQAANIAWALGPTFNGPTGHLGILTNGTLVEAVDMLGTTIPPVVVDPMGLNITFTTVNSPYFGWVWGAATGGGNTDPGWSFILNQFEWNNGVDVSAPGFLSGLTAGHPYQVQFFASRSDCCTDRTHWYGDGNGNLSTPVSGGSYISVVGTFTADAATQWIEVFDSTQNPILNAYVLRDLTPVPEPGTVALLLAGLAAAGGLARRRRG